MGREAWIGSNEYIYVQLLKKREKFLNQIDKEIIQLEQEIFGVD